MPSLISRRNPMPVPTRARLLVHVVTPWHMWSPTWWTRVKRWRVPFSARANDESFPRCQHHRALLRHHRAPPPPQRHHQQQQQEPEGRRRSHPSHHECKPRQPPNCHHLSSIIHHPIVSIHRPIVCRLSSSSLDFGVLSSDWLFFIIAFSSGPVSITENLKHIYHIDIAIENTTPLHSTIGILPPRPPTGEQRTTMFSRVVCTGRRTITRSSSQLERTAFRLHGGVHPAPASFSPCTLSLRCTPSLVVPVSSHPAHRCWHHWWGRSFSRCFSSAAHHLRLQAVSSDSSPSLTHICATTNRPQMVDVSHKKDTLRSATARCFVRLPAHVWSALSETQSASEPSAVQQERHGSVFPEPLTKKGPLFSTAIIAGVMGAKQTSSLIPFCHPLALQDCQVDIRALSAQEQPSRPAGAETHLNRMGTSLLHGLDGGDAGDQLLQIECTAKVTGKTGVEMEALTGCSIAALTVYDMCKALSHAIRIEGLHLCSKSGGKSET
mmetsp:Transcript_3412/g.8168  ORF Transcript_3412/g.8168 Transcript_3412/m.8168 type:complete len:494 (+) Transcript_3412:2111-3592(+)